MRLLIVDDSSIVRSRIARLLGTCGLGDTVIVGMAKNGVEALNLFVQTRPDVVTMDLTMPEMDGVECTEAMMRLNADARILVVSALSDKATAIKALQKGAQGFLYKPFTDEQLIAALGELMAEA
jgi:two-component system chemotaxis response regulator CheY